MKVAIVCDWLTGTGGAERVVLELHKMFPQAPIYTSQYNKDPKVWHGRNWFESADVRTLWLQKLPGSLRKFLPILRAWAFSRLDLSGYDLVISSSGAEAKGVKTGASTTHISYCHSPTHYYWVRYNEYIKNPGFGRLDPLARLGLRLFVRPLRRWDYKAAQKPNFIIANSTHTQKMIQKFYNRSSAVIHPPIDIERFSSKPSQFRKGFITVGRQAPYMRKDLAVQACTQLGLPLVVLGDGPEHRKLVKMAGPSVTFINRPTDGDVAERFRAVEAFIFPGMEDFGIVAVEALAAGLPLIAYRAGGALDYVQEGTNGQFFDKQSVPSLVEALNKFSVKKFSESEVKKTSLKFSAVNFTQSMKAFIDETKKH